MLKNGVILIIIVSMLCVSMSGAAFSVNNEVTPKTDLYPINLPTESSAVNTKVLQGINNKVEKYLNIGQEGTYKLKSSEDFKNVRFPWSDRTLAPGDFVDWIIYVNFNDKHFEKVLSISPKDFKDRFLKHPEHYESIYFDVDENGVNDLRVYYSIYTSQIYNANEGIKVKSLESCLKVDTSQILDEYRYAKLEVSSEIRFNYGLIKARSHERSVIFNERFANLFNRIIERIQNRIENTNFAPLRKIMQMMIDRMQIISNRNSEPDIGVLANENDHINIGIGVASPQGEKIPIFYEKRFAVGKENIFKPTVFEHELKQVTSKEPLALIFGFQAFQEGSSTPKYDISFSIEFDPAIYICTQFIPLGGYVYYKFDTASAHNQQTRVSFYSNLLNLGPDEENIELVLIFDSTTKIASSVNWMSFDLTINPIGFNYKANKKFDIGLLVSSPFLSGRLKFSGIPNEIKLYFDVDLSLYIDPGYEFDADATASINLEMSSVLDNIILYYPKLSSDEPDIEFLKVSDIPSKQSLSAHTNLYILNQSMATIKGEGYLDFTMSSDLGDISIYHYNPDPEAPKEVFIRLPYGIPRSQRVGLQGHLYIDLDDFSNQANYVYGRAYRTSSGNIQEISGYLPGIEKPLVKITEIPSNSEARGKLEWNKLKGYAYATRNSAYNPDPIEINLDIGTFNLYNYLEIQDGHISTDFHLAQDGYFGFDTANDMFGDTLTITDTSTGNQLSLSAYKVNANDLWADWALNLSSSPINVQELSFGGELSILEDFHITATLQGKYLHFETDWHVGEEGSFSIDFTQDNPIELIIDDLFPDNPKFNFGGGVIISQNFHFDISWKWKQGEWGNPGYFKINKDTNNPNFNWIGMTLEYTPDGYTTPQFGIEVGGTNVGLLVFLEWYKAGLLPTVWWYVHITGNFYLHLLWNGDWYPNVHLW